VCRKARSEAGVVDLRLELWLKLGDGEVREAAYRGG
jgi:hypothetical protein